MEPLLFSISLLYGTAVWLRNRAYDLRLLPSVRMECVVISIGSLSAGGSGKTPFAALLARLIVRIGRRPLLVARGYGAPRPSPYARLLSTGRPRARLAETWETVGEEAVLLARLAPEVPVAVARRREEAAEAAKGGECDPEVLVLDGGLQYRRLIADYSIILIDASNRPRRTRLLPLGGMREPWSGLRRADHIVLHRAELCRDRDAWERFLERRAPGRPRVWCENRLEIPYPLSFPDLPVLGGWAELAARRLGVWTALGHPEAFLSGLEIYGIRPVWTHLGRDHAAFGEREVDELIWAARREHLDGFLVTEKDAIKMEPMSGHLPPVFVVPATLKLGRGKAQLDEALQNLLMRSSSRAQNQ